MSKRQKESKPMSFSGISKRMTTRSYVREKSSILASNSSNVTSTEPSTLVDGYTYIETMFFKNRSESFAYFKHLNLFLLLLRHLFTYSLSV